MKKIPKSIIAIIAIAVLVGIALYRGINTGLLGTALGLIAGLGGYTVYQAVHQPKA